MNIIKLLELDENTQILEEKEIENNSQKKDELKSIKQPTKDGKDFNISGQWLLLDELVEINNQYLLSQKDEKKEITWIRLPDKYVEEDYMVDYDSDDQCPLGVDVLIKEDGYPIGVIAGCDSIKQAKVNNNLDGHKYKGYLGIKLNNDYFLTYNNEEEFKLVKTHMDWDRGKHTI